MQALQMPRRSPGWCWRAKAWLAPHRRGGGFDVSQRDLEGIGAGRISERGHGGSLRYKLAQQLQLLGYQFGIVKVNTGQITLWPREALDQTEPHRVFGDDEYDRDCRGCRFCSQYCKRSLRSQ